MDISYSDLNINYPIYITNTTVGTGVTSIFDSDSEVVGIGTTFLDNIYNINIHMHKRRLTEDQDLFVRLGDFVQYDEMYFEIVDVFEPRYLFGQDSSFTNDETALEITAVAKQARRGLFNAN